jgi:hypothetical protein
MTARFSTGVIPEGTAITTRGLTAQFRPWTLKMKYLSIASVTSKSAMTPSFMGRMATMLAGVLPSISFAVAPTARPPRRTSVVPFRTATTEGSFRTMPRPRTQTRVLAVPRSMPMSTENFPRIQSRTRIQGGL